MFKIKGVKRGDRGLVTESNINSPLEDPGRDHAALKSHKTLLSGQHLKGARKFQRLVQHDTTHTSHFMIIFSSFESLAITEFFSVKNRR